MRVSDALAVAVGYSIVAGGVLLGLRYFEPVRVGGASMAPALVAGDIAIVRRGGHVSEGEIVLMDRAGAGPVLHRVVGIAPDGTVTTKGDANLAQDAGAAAPEEIVGPVSAVVPVGALVQRWRR